MAIKHGGRGPGHLSRWPKAAGGPAPFPLDAFSGPAALVAVGSMAWSESMVGETLVTAGGADYTADDTGFVAGTFAGETVSKLWPQVGTAFFEQATSSAKPTIWPSAREGWPELRMHDRFGTLGSKVLVINTPPTARSRDWTHVWVQIAAQETYSGGQSLLSTGTLMSSLSGGSFFGNSTAGSPSTGSWTARNRIWTGGGGWVDSNAPAFPSLRFTVHAMRLNADGAAMFVDGKKTVVTGSVSATSVQPYKIGQLNDFGLYNDCVSFLGSAWFPSLTDAEIEELTGLIQNKLHGVAALPSAIWVFDGDSITAGYSADDGGRDRRDLSWPYLLAGSLNANVTGINLAVTSAHLETTANSEHKLMTNQAGKVNALIGSGSGYTKRVVILSAGTNDIVYGAADAASIVTQLSTYKSSAETAGATRVLIATQIPRQGLTGGQETMRQDLNTSILSTFGSDAVDVAAQTWQPGGSGDWTTNYQDGIHPNAAGRQLFVNAFSSVLSGLV